VPTARAISVAGDVHRYGFPRSDLQVTLDGVTIRPALALSGWAAFKPAHGGAMVMGDLVLLETEINPVMAKLSAELCCVAKAWRRLPEQAEPRRVRPMV
jgi:hypothetical protein